MMNEPIAAVRKLTGWLLAGSVHKEFLWIAFSEEVTCAMLKTDSTSLNLGSTGTEEVADKEALSDGSKPLVMCALIRSASFSKNLSCRWGGRN